MAPKDKPARAMSRHTRRLAILARGVVTPSVLDACLREREPGGLLDRLVHEGALDSRQARDLERRADTSQRLPVFKPLPPLPNIDALAGKELAGIRLLHKLGQGGTGTVYAGRTKDGQKVAVKILEPALAHRGPTRRRFFSEAQALIRIDDPRIVRVHWGGKDRNLYYLVLEYVSTETLEDLVRARARLEPDVALRLACQVALGLAAAHEEGIVHRDVKPRNILVLDESRAKLADFGNALVSEQTRRIVVGSVRFMAPEQCLDARIDHRCDIYSLGAVLHYALCGSPPFDGLKVMQIVQGHLSKPPPPLRSLRPELPAQLEALVLRCLAKEPQARFADASQLLHALTRTLGLLAG